MYLQSPPPRQEPPPDHNQLLLRAAALGVLAAVLFGVLVFRLWALQVLHSDHYVAQANQNDVRQLALPAPRGAIEDRTGAVLVKNTSHILAEVNPAGLPTKVDCTTFPLDAQALCNEQVAAAPPGAVPRCKALPDQARCLALARLGRVLDVKRHDIWNAYEKTLYVKPDGSGGCTPAKGSPCFVVNAGAPVQIKTATEAQVAYVLERRSSFPGVQFLETTQRRYPFHDLAPNVLGYTGQVNSTELKMEKFANQKPGDVIGQAASSTPTTPTCAALTACSSRTTTPPAARSERPICRRRRSRATRCGCRSTTGCRRWRRRRSATASRSPTTTVRPVPTSVRSWP